jgi:type II secretory pathway component PulK
MRTFLPSHSRFGARLCEPQRVRNSSGIRIKRDRFDWPRVLRLTEPRSGENENGWSVPIKFSTPPPRSGRRSGQGGSVLIIVLWIAFGLVSITLYFAHSMSFELRASENRASALEAAQAIEGAARYVSHLLANLEEPGRLPDPLTYETEAAPVGTATFWLIGRGDSDGQFSTPYFGLIDEASKLNLNTATAEMLEALPMMTSEFAAAIVDWRDEDSEITSGGAESETYQRLIPSYACKNAPFETVDELRLVYGATMEMLFGEDANWNGVLDRNEDDGDQTLPNDNRNGRLDPGLLEFVTVHTREPNTRSDGSRRLNISNLNANTRNTLLELARERGIEQFRAEQILPPAGAYTSVLHFYAASRMEADEFALIEGEITISNEDFIEGLINVNTASADVLAALPGMDYDRASAMVAHRQSDPNRTASVAWVKEVLEERTVQQAGPFLTGRSYQFAADIAAVGRHGRGYRRARFVFDLSEGTPKMIHRQDLTHLGWALGPQVREDLLAAKEIR